MKLANLVDISLGYPFRGKINESLGSSVLAVQMRDASSKKGVDWSTCKSVVLEGKKGPDWLKPGDILLATRGSSNYAVLIESAPPDGMTAVATPHFYVLRAKQASILPGYLHWWLNQRPSQRHFETQAEGTHTKSIRRAVLEEVPIVVPPLEEQQMLAGLSAAMNQQNSLLNQQLANNKALQTAIAGDLLNKYEY